MTTPQSTSGELNGRSDQGFTLIELVIVMVIIGILMAVVIPTFRTPKQTANRKLTSSTAQTFVAAVDQFKLDHSGRAPVIGAAAEPNVDWARETIEQGPLEPLIDPQTQQRGRYIKGGAPEAVSDGRIVVADGEANAPTSLDSELAGAVVYISGASLTPPLRTEYTVVVLTRDKGSNDTVIHCYDGSDAVFTASAFATDTAKWKTLSGGAAGRC